MRCFRFLPVFAFLASACSTTDNAGRQNVNGSGGSSGTIGTGSAGSSIIVTGSGGGNISVDAGGGVVRPLDGMIVVDGGNHVMVSGMPTTVQFHVQLRDGSNATGIVWTVDDTRIGSVGDDGVFHANGFVGGVVTITATIGGSAATTMITVDVAIVDNPINLPPADQGVLVAGGTADPTFKWLYPYDQTVFPRGLQAPALQFAGTSADAMYVEIAAPHFSYKQFAAGTTPLRATLPEPVWNGVTLTVGPKDPVSVQVTKRAGASVSGPVKESWLVAQATLKGLIYYVTYKSPLAQKGGVMRLRPGQTAEVVQAGCSVCHSVSAHGNVLALGLDYLPVNDPNMPDESLNPIDSATYDLSTAGTATLRTKSSEGRTFAFAALTPDGKAAITNGLPVDRWPPFIVFGERAPKGYPSKLVDTSTGLEIVAPSFSSVVTYAQSPAFSPDGAHLAFANGDRLDRRVLTVMDYDGSTTPPTFSNPRDLINQTTAAVAWPSFLPDSKAILYHEGDSFDSRIFSDGDAPSKPQYAELRLVEIDDKTVKPLDAINGHLPGGALYLPSFNEVGEGRMNYEPNVLPVPVGGYYWVLFTSRRTYGNTIAPGGTLATGDDLWGRDSAPSVRKKLWIAAIDIDHVGKDDPSHPALYLPGQEVESGNMRGFGALAPCQAQGATCESGADCCDGFCRETGRSADGVPTLMCVPPPMKCSFVDETCTTSADCCDKSNLCIASRCTTEIPK